MDSKIELDVRSFKALSADARVSILKHLRSRRYTQSELADLLNLKIPTVKEHLQALEKADLVRKIDEGRKWKYYELTDKSRAVLNPESKSIFIVVGLFLFSALAALFSFQKYLEQPISILSQKVLPAQETVMAKYTLTNVFNSADRDIVNNTVQEVQQQVVQQSSYWNIAFYAFFIISIVLLIVLVYLLFKRRKISSSF